MKGLSKHEIHDKKSVKNSRKMGTGRERKAEMETIHGKCLIKIIIQYTGWILQHNVSLQHWLDPFAKTIETL